MNFKDRIELFHELGNQLAEFGIDGTEKELLEKVHAGNQWFIPENVKYAITALSEMLTKPNIEKWLSDYPEITNSRKISKIGVVMAGNIPLVGFHDMLSVLLSGNIFIGKFSSKDELLINYIVQKLISINSSIGEQIILTDKILADFDAVIATGSNNTSRYFEYYFGKYPHIIRRNRNSVAILSGEETPGDFKLLAKDIFLYFGLGCRNVSKLFIPENFNIESLFPHFEEYIYCKNHYKYVNNYDYNKAIYLMNNIPHFDNGFAIVTKNESYASAVSVIHYEPYTDKQQLIDKILSDEAKIQCVVSKQGFIPKNPTTVGFGKTQKPGLQDYADNVDTMRFLLQL